jgi:hypothetical protein
VNIFDYIRSPWTPTPPYLPPKADSLPLAVGACDADEDAVAAPRLVVVRKPVASRAIGDVAVSSVRLREVVPVAAAAWAAVFEVVVGRVHACSRVVFLWLFGAGGLRSRATITHHPFWSGDEKTIDAVFGWHCLWFQVASRSTIPLFINTIVLNVS